MDRSGAALQAPLLRSSSEAMLIDYGSVEDGFESYGAPSSSSSLKRSGKGTLAGCDDFVDVDDVIDGDVEEDYSHLIHQYEAAWKRENDDINEETNRKVAGLVRDFERSSSSSSGPFGAVIYGAIVVGVAVLVFVAAVSTRDFLAKPGTTSSSSASSSSGADASEPPAAVSSSSSPPPTFAPILRTVIVPSPAPSRGAPVETGWPTRAPVTLGPTKAVPAATVYDGGALAAGQLAAVVRNEYSVYEKTMFPYPFLADALLMEPHRASTVTLFGSSAGGSGCSVAWSLEYADSAAGVATLSGVTTEGAFSTAVFVVTPTKTGKYTLTASDPCSGASLTQTVWVKYVRRELQSLTDNDREEFLQAFKTLWDVNTRDGVEVYGPRYKSLAYFAVLHNDGGGNGICDEFHAGSGFINNHLYLGAYLEQSLRLVNPRVSLHYMEYSKYFESVDFKGRISTLDGGAWTELMTDKWFGSNDPVTGEIINSRWAHQQIPYLDSAFFYNEMIDETATFFPVEEAQWLKVLPPHLASPYGLLRSPWNYNPAPVLTRYNNMHQIQFNSVVATAKIFYMGSDCAEYQSFVKKYAVGQTFQTYLTESEDNVHGKVHFTIGGAGGTKAKAVDDLLKAKFGWTDDDIMFISRGSQAVYKSFIPRKWVATNPLSCTADPWQGGALAASATAAPGEVGGPSCTCDPQYMTTEDQLAALIGFYAIRNANFVYGLDFEERKAAMQLVCSRMAFDGDMASSGAANDPLFWVAHGAIERLYQRVVFEGALVDNVYVNPKVRLWPAWKCSFEPCKPSHPGIPTPSPALVNPKRNECSGHTADGTKAWLKGYYLQDESVDAAALTNAELADILDPTGDKVLHLSSPYIAPI